MNFTDQKTSDQGQIDLRDIVVQDMGDEEMARDASDKNLRNPEVIENGTGSNRLNGEGAYASFAGNGALEHMERDATNDKLLGLADLDPNEYLKSLHLDGENDESAAAALGLGEI